MASFEIITFRPQSEFIPDFDELRLWCESNQTTFSGVINAFLPAINYACHNTVITGDDGLRYIEADFGHIHLPQNKLIREAIYSNGKRKIRAPRAKL